MSPDQTTTAHRLFQSLVLQSYKELRTAHLLMLRLPSDDLLELGYGGLIVASRDGEDRLTKDLAHFV
jgi:hypothetical protein